ncbi:putative Membrane-associated tyrosine- and threonine-specific cdc2-inhibitory kinase [Blattamonas nauphoetae]|uniref:Membrane-associated tyrosine- and threonine-specific cdc2-inhibitory kinase n=1 Tax=Blattamonas nauphoetae TaxID=2049346 RepID=A0ABQ9XXQ3_9EUKA|nr:putative Membrane-associated tyrosine- and threonine-specific cdc2-inhibitory kinase [Blattamonas nauphoetae]
MQPGVIVNRGRISEFASTIGEPYQVLSFIGSGSFGDVYKVYDQDTGLFYAAKWSKKRHRGTSDRKATLLELFTFAYIYPHPHIVGFHKAWEQDGYMITLTELCECGDLEGFISERSLLKENEIWKILTDLTLATKQLHEQEVIHLDIKPDNIFLTENGDYRLGDFGLSHITDWTSASSEGDSRYLAPEVLSRSATTKADIFSIGATIFEASERVEMPTQGPLWHRLREDPPPLENRSQELTDLTHAMLRHDASQRPTADEILQHPRIREELHRRNWPVQTQVSLMLRRLCHITSLFWKGYYDLIKLPPDDEFDMNRSPFDFFPTNTFFDDDPHRPTQQKEKTPHPFRLTSFCIPPNPHIFESRTTQIDEMLAILETHEENLDEEDDDATDASLTERVDSDADEDTATATETSPQIPTPATERITAELETLTLNTQNSPAPFPSVDPPSSPFHNYNIHPANHIPTPPSSSHRPVNIITNLPTLHRTSSSLKNPLPNIFPADRLSHSMSLVLRPSSLQFQHRQSEALPRPHNKQPSHHHHHKSGVIRALSQIFPDPSNSPVPKQKQPISPQQHSETTSMHSIPHINSQPTDSHQQTSSQLNNLSFMLHRRGSVIIHNPTDLDASGQTGSEEDRTSLHFPTVSSKADHKPGHPFDEKALGSPAAHTRFDGAATHDGNLPCPPRSSALLERTSPLYHSKSYASTPTANRLSPISFITTQSDSTGSEPQDLSSGLALSQDDHRSLLRRDSRQAESRFVIARAHEPLFQRTQSTRQLIARPPLQRSMSVYNQGSFNVASFQPLQHHPSFPVDDLGRMFISETVEKSTLSRDGLSSSDTTADTVVPLAPRHSPGHTDDQSVRSRPSFSDQSFKRRRPQFDKFNAGHTESTLIGPKPITHSPLGSPPQFQPLFPTQSISSRYPSTQPNLFSTAPYRPLRPTQSLAVSPTTRSDSQFSGRNMSTGHSPNSPHTLTSTRSGKRQRPSPPSLQRRPTVKAGDLHKDIIERASILTSTKSNNRTITDYDIMFSAESSRTMEEPTPNSSNPTRHTPSYLSPIRFTHSSPYRSDQTHQPIGPLSPTLITPHTTHSLNVEDDDGPLPLNESVVAIPPLSSQPHSSDGLSSPKAPSLRADSFNASSGSGFRDSLDTPLHPSIGGEYNPFLSRVQVTPMQHKTPIVSNTWINPTLSPSSTYKDSTPTTSQVSSEGSPVFFRQWTPETQHQSSLSTPLPSRTAQTLPHQRRQITSSLPPISPTGEELGTPGFGFSTPHDGLHTPELLSDSDSDTPAPYSPIKQDRVTSMKKRPRDKKKKPSNDSLLRSAMPVRCNPNQLTIASPEDDIMMSVYGRGSITAGLTPTALRSPNVPDSDIDPDDPFNLPPTMHQPYASFDSWSSPSTFPDESPLHERELASPETLTTTLTTPLKQTGGQAPALKQFDYSSGDSSQRVWGGTTDTLLTKQDLISPESEAHESYFPPTDEQTTPTNEQLGTTPPWKSTNLEDIIKSPEISSPFRTSDITNSAVTEKGVESSNQSTVSSLVRHKESGQKNDICSVSVYVLDLFAIMGNAELLAVMTPLSLSVTFNLISVSTSTSAFVRLFQCAFSFTSLRPLAPSTPPSHSTHLSPLQSPRPSDIPDKAAEMSEADFRVEYPLIFEHSGSFDEDETDMSGFSALSHTLYGDSKKIFVEESAEERERTEAEQKQVELRSKIGGKLAAMLVVSYFRCNYNGLHLSRADVEKADERRRQAVLKEKELHEKKITEMSSSAVSHRTQNTLFAGNILDSPAMDEIASFCSAHDSVGHMPIDSDATPVKSLLDTQPLVGNNFIQNPLSPFQLPTRPDGTLNIPTNRASQRSHTPPPPSSLNPKRIHRRRATVAFVLAEDSPSNVQRPFPPSFPLWKTMKAGAGHKNGSNESSMMGTAISQMSFDRPFQSPGLLDWSLRERRGVDGSANGSLASSFRWDLSFGGQGIVEDGTGKGLPSEKMLDTLRTAHTGPEVGSQTDRRVSEKSRDSRAKTGRRQSGLAGNQVLDVAESKGRITFTPMRSKETLKMENSLLSQTKNHSNLARTAVLPHTAPMEVSLPSTSMTRRTAPVKLNNDTTKPQLDPKVSSAHHIPIMSTLSEDEHTTPLPLPTLQMYDTPLTAEHTHLTDEEFESEWYEDSHLSEEEFITKHHYPNKPIIPLHLLKVAAVHILLCLFS